MSNKRLYFVLIILVSFIATAISIYDLTQRFGKNNFGAFLSLFQAIVFGCWMIYYLRKLARYKAESGEAPGV